MENKIKIAFLATFLLLLASFTYALDSSTNFNNFSFEEGLTSWTIFKSGFGSPTPGSEILGELVLTNEATDGIQSLEMDATRPGQTGQTGFEYQLKNSVLQNMKNEGDKVIFDYKVIAQSEIGNGHKIVYNDSSNVRRQLVAEASGCDTYSNTSAFNDNNSASFHEIIIEAPACFDPHPTNPDINIVFVYRVSCGGGCGGTDTSSWRVDNFRLETSVTGQLDLTITEPIEPVATNTNFEIRTTVFDNVEEIDVSDADVNINFNNTGFVDMPFSNGAYRFTGTTPLEAGDYNIFITADKGEAGDYDTSQFESTLIVRKKEFQYLTFTPIENISSFSFGSITINPSGFANQVIWRVDSNSTIAETPKFILINSLRDSRQYFIFTSSDGINYAFNDTLTYGSTNINPIQKIWDEDLGPSGKYRHSFEDTLTAGETKFYKLIYRMPYKHWFSIKNSTEWFNQLEPIIEDFNTFSTDLFISSEFSKIRSVFIEPVPDVNVDFSSAFEFQFTAWSNADSTTLRVGTTTNINGTDSVENVVIDRTPRRYSITIDADNFESQIVFKTTFELLREIHITDYAIVQRAYFTKRLEILKIDGDTLNVFLLNNLSRAYLQEGNKFKISTEAYDRDGILQRLDIEAYFGSVSAGNLFNRQIFFPYDIDNTNQENKAETRLIFNENFEGLIDTNGNATNPIPPRTLIIRANLLDNNGNVSAIQSENIIFLQYPYFPDDLVINFFPTEKRRGKHPKGALELTLKRPDTLKAIDIRIWDENTSVTNPDFQEVLYKGQDFDCIGPVCSFQVEIDKWVFEDVNLNTISIIALLNTEELDLDNRLTRTDRKIFVSAIDFEIAKIHQLVERADDIYRNDEEISLVLVLRDDEVTDTSDKLDIFLKIRNCDSNIGSPNCEDQTIEWKPTAHIYDDSLGINYYFFRHFFVLDDGSLLPDGNFISFRATVQDQLGIRTAITPVLASKCKNKDFVSEFLNNPIAAIGSFVFEAITGLTEPCNTAQEDIVTTTVNADQEEFLEIDADHTTTAPSQEGFICISPDSNNIINDPFKQDFVCAVVYTVGEKPIDNFRFRITNEFSDVRKEGPSQTFVEFNFPFEIIAYNDIFLLQNELKLNQNTTVDTLGEFIYEGFRNIVKENLEANNLTSFAIFSLKQGTVENLGGDINFNLAFSPQNVTGVYFIEIQGLPVLNMQDFRNDPRLTDDFEEIPSKQFLQVLSERNIPFDKPITKSKIFTTSFISPFPFESEGILLINENASKQINTRNLADNASRNFNSIPSTLRFNIQNTMFYNNFSEQSVLTGYITVTAIIKDRFNDALGFFNAILKFFGEFAQDPVGVGIEFLFQNIVLLMILAGILTIGGIIIVLYVRK